MINAVPFCRSLALVSVAALVVGCGSPKEGVLWDATHIAVADMHLHPGEWDSIPPATQEFLASRFPFPLSLNPSGLSANTLSPEGMLKEMDKAGVTVSGVLAVYAPNSVGIAPNELITEHVRANANRFTGLASLRVDNWTYDESAELGRLASALDQPEFTGIKLAHAHQRFRMDDPSYYGIYALAQDRSVPVYLHTGTSPFPGTMQDPSYTDPAYLEEAIQDYPGATFILGHLGYDFVTEELGSLETCLRLAREYPNVYLEPSAMGSGDREPDLRHALQRILEEDLTDKVIYGSDGPQFPGFVADYLTRTTTNMKELGYTRGQAESVLHGNFERVFGVEVSDAP